MILDLHHRHSAEGSTEVQGNAPLLSVTHGEKETPESSYPLSHIRQDERAGRDSQEAFAQRASEKWGRQIPRDDNRGTTRLVPASNLKIRFRVPSLALVIKTRDNATTTAALLDRSLPPILGTKIRFRVPSLALVIKMRGGASTTGQRDPSQQQPQSY